MPDFGADKNPIFTDYYIFIDTADSNKIKAKNGVTGLIDYSHATSFDSVFNSVIGADANPVYILLGKGNFPLTTAAANISKNNVTVRGSGKGVTKIVVDAAYTADHIIKSTGGGTGSDCPLTANALKKQKNMTVSTGNSATFSVGDYFLLKSIEQIDSESSTRFQGEIHRVEAVNTGTGVITSEDVLYSDYTTTNTSAIKKLNIKKNISISDLTITSAGGTTWGAGKRTINLSYVDGFDIASVEITDVWEEGFHFLSCMNGSISDCSVYNIGGASTAQYGIAMFGAMKNISIKGCRGLGKIRHLTVTGASSGTDNEGSPRNITISNCTSELATVAHYDTHESCEGVVFNACTSIGGIPPTTGSLVYGFQNRSKGTIYNGCVSIQAIGDAFYIKGTRAHNTKIIGCHISSTQKTLNTLSGGRGVFMDASLKNTIISGCTFIDLDSSAVLNSTTTGASDGTRIQNCHIENTNIITSGYSIDLFNSNNVSLIANTICNNTSAIGKPFRMGGTTGDLWIVSNNQFFGNTSNVPVTTLTNSLFVSNIASGWVP